MTLSFPKSRIGLRLSLQAVLISLALGIVSTFVFYTIETRIDQARMYEQGEELVSTIKPQLVTSLWDFDDKSTKLLVESLKDSLFFSEAQLVSAGQITRQDQSSDAIQGDLVVPLFHGQESLGELHLNYNYETIKETALARLKMGVYILFSVIGLSGLLFYLLVNHSIIQHILEIKKAKHQSPGDENSQYEPVELNRKNYQDELSDLVETLNNSRKQSIELFETKKNYQEKMEYQANFDLLTGLPNRRHLESYLKDQLENYVDHKGDLIVMFIDLDGFKKINDSLGHGVGDAALRASADKIKIIIEKNNGYIARLGGDEFIACLYVSDVNESDCIAQEIINAFSEKVDCQGMLTYLGCSIGITTYPDSQVDSEKQLIRNADSALYEAKSLGKNTFFRFNDEMFKEYVYHQKITDKLPAAIERELFDIHFQPLMDIQENKVIGFEALLRWHDEELGFIRPDIFISIAEKMGVVFDLDVFVFKKAKAYVKKVREIYQNDFILSVNFSPTNFYHAKFFDWIREELSTEDRDLEWMELEVTERLMLNTDPVVLEGIKELRKRGIKFSIDDFGIGYSSLGYIKKFNGIFSKIKIDRLFTNEILSGGFDIAFIRCIMMLADSLNMQVLIEGVEEKEQVECLKKLGCCYAQGYYYAKPLPLDELYAFLDQQFSPHTNGLNPSVLGRSDRAYLPTRGH